MVKYHLLLELMLVKPLAMKEVALRAAMDWSVSTENMSLMEPGSTERILMLVGSTTKKEASTAAVSA